MSFSDVVSWLNQGWVSLIWGTVVAYVAYKMGRRRAAPRALITAEQELTWGRQKALPAGIEVKFNGRVIPRISRGLLRLWNSGSETLMGTTVAPTDALRLEIEEGEFLMCHLLKESSPACRCEVQTSPQVPTVVNLKFDFLDPNQGMLVGFLHTGSTAKPTLKGTLRGHPIKIEHEPTPAAGLRRMARRFAKYGTQMPYVVLVSGLLMLAVSLAPESWSEYLRNADAVVRQPSRPSRFFFASAGAAYIGLAGFMIWSKRRKYPKSLELPSPTAPITKLKGGNP